MYFFDTYSCKYFCNLKSVVTSGILSLELLLNCLSVFDHFVRFERKWLRAKKIIFTPRREQKCIYDPVKRL